MNVTMCPLGGRKSKGMTVGITLAFTPHLKEADPQNHKVTSATPGLKTLKGKTVK